MLNFILEEDKVYEVTDIILFLYKITWFIHQCLLRNLCRYFLSILFYGYTPIAYTVILIYNMYTRSIFKIFKIQDIYCVVYMRICNRNDTINFKNNC